MWEPQPVNRLWPLPCCPMETQTLVVWQEGQSLSCSSLLSDSNISWFHNLHRLLANKSPAHPETFCFHSPGTTDLLTTLTQPRHNNNTLNQPPVPLLPLPTGGAFSSNMHPWPQITATSYPGDPPPPVQTLNHAQVLVWLDPQTKNVNLGWAQTRHIANVSIIFRFQSGCQASFLR